MIRHRPLPTTIPLSALAVATLIAVVVVLLTALLMDDAQAQVAAASAVPAATAGSGSPFLAMMQGLVGLVIVIGVIFAAGWLMKKIGPRTRSSGVVQVVGGASVGPREKVVVVRFGGQTLLLGVAPGQVSLLHTAEAGEAVDEPATAASAPRFVDRLRAARSDS
jgi:flagellar protein FliO/FliZ